jgi:hypothetical protein
VLCRVLVVLFVSLPSLAQLRLVTGQVQDTTGAVIPGARVFVDRAPLTLTDSQGRFQFQLDSQRDCVIRVQASGFAPHEQRLIAGNRDVSLVFDLPIAEQHADVTVHGEVAEAGLAQTPGGTRSSQARIYSAPASWT